MNLITKSLPVALLAAVPAFVCTSGWAQDASPACASVSNIERRIVAHAEGDVASLRSFVNMTAIVHGINMVDVKENLDTWRAAIECRRQVGAVSAADVKVAKTTADDINVLIQASQR